MHNKRIVVDLDDTISKTLDRDFINAEPITSTIKKVNEFYNNGYEVVILTARGQISCKGDYLKADKKYRTQIELWLSKNKVKYHKLSFNKILAKFYIDDKALTPIEFANIKEVKMTKGKSGADVISDGSIVTKQSSNSKSEIFWYNLVGRFKKPFKTPKIYSLVGDTIKMEHIYSGNFVEPDDTLKFINNSESIKNTLLFFKGNKGTNSPFSTYIERIKKHTVKNNIEHVLNNEFFKELSHISLFMDKESSLNHGDFTLDNMLIGNMGEYFLIDSIYNEDLYSSYIIDATKLIYDLRLKGNKKAIQEIIEMMLILKIPLKVLLLMEVCHWVRVLSYIKEESLRLRYIGQIKIILNDIR